MRMLADGDCEDLVHYARPTQSRTCTAWYLTALDSFLRLKCFHGFEAFSSPTTAEKAKFFSGAKSDKDYVADLPNVCKSQLHDYEWCALGIDGWSVGTCGGNYLKYGLETYTEVLVDGVHGIHRCVIGALNASERWTLFMIMKLLYNYNKAPWMSSKYLKECRECLVEALERTPEALKVLWDVLVPNIGRDTGDRKLVHDQKRSDAMLHALPEDKVVTAQGPRMSICGWQSYRRGALYWDPMHNKRTFVTVVHAVKRGLCVKNLGDIDFHIKPLTRSVPEGQTKTAKDKATQDLRTIGDDLVQSVALIHLQGWRLQRQIRAVVVATGSVDKFYDRYHKGCRGPVGCLTHYQELSDPERGVQHVAEVFDAWSDARNLEYLGYVLEEQDLPMTITSTTAARYIDEEKTNLKEDFTLQIALAGHLLRRALWHLEGLPGVHVLYKLKIITKNKPPPNETKSIVVFAMVYCLNLYHRRINDHWRVDWSG